MNFCFLWLSSQIWIALPDFTFRLNRRSCLDHHRFWILVQVASNLLGVDRLHIAVLAQSTAGCVQESGEVCWFVLRKKDAVNRVTFAYYSKPDNSSNPCRHRENRDHQDDTCIMMMILCKIFNWPMFLSFPPAGVLKVLPDVVLLPTASVVAHLNSHHQPVNSSLKMSFSHSKYHQN